MNIIHKSKTHNQLLDAFKFLAAFAVMHLHTTLGNVGEERSTVIRLACRWAVPFFFISAGYYLGQKHQTSKISLSAITANLVNLIGIFVVANITYLILSLGSGYIWFTNDVKYLFVGTFWHLWFLGSMIFAYLLIWFIDEVLGRATLYACGIMTLLSCIIVAIATTHLPVKINYDELPRFMSGFAFMVLGMLLSKVNIFRINKSFILSFVLLSIACIFAEVYGYHLGNALNSDLEMSVGIAMLAVSLFIISQAFSIRENIFSTMGKRYALFIYLYHVLVFKIMIKCFAILKVNPAPLYIFFPIFALAILLGTVYLLETKFGRVFALLNGKLQVAKIINN